MMQGSLATRLRILRVQQGLMIGEAADLMGIDRHTLGRVEQGTQMPHAPTLKKIAAGYGVSVEDLLQVGLVEEPVPAGKAEAPEEAGPSEAGDEERRIIDMSPAAFYKKLSEALSNEDLLDLYHQIDAERVATELAYLDDEDNDHALKDYERGMRFYMMAALSLSIRGETPPDPEQLALQAGKLEKLRR